MKRKKNDESKPSDAGGLNQPQEKATRELLELLSEFIAKQHLRRLLEESQSEDHSEESNPPSQEDKPDGQ